MIYAKRRQKFIEFHKQNPQVFKLLVKYARKVKKRGYKKYSIKALFERVRWHIDIETKRLDGFKLSNNHHSFYARKIMAEYPDEFENFFTIKESSRF